MIAFSANVLYLECPAKSLALRLRFFIVLLVTCFSTVLAFSQDPSFSQVENTRFYVHSSDTYLRSGIELQAAFRSQWNRIPGAFNTSFLSVFYQHEKMRTGFGFKYMSDKEGIGALRTDDIKLVTRYNILPVVSNRPRALYVSIEAGYIRKSIDWSRLVFSDQIDPVWGIYQGSSIQPPDRINSGFFDATFSTTFRDKIRINQINYPYSISASWRHMAFEKDESLMKIGTRLPGIFTATFSGIIAPSKFYRIPLLKPVIRYEHQFNLKRIVFGSLIGIVNDEHQETIYSGLYYSSQFNPFTPLNTNGLVFMVGYEKVINRTLMSFAYSYDLNNGGLGAAGSSGSHELTLNIQLSSSNKGFSQPSSIFQKCPEGK